MKPYILTVLLLFAPILASAEELNGKVIWVTDGDTIGLLIEGNEKVNIRLDDIDAPELGQEYGVESKQALSDKEERETWEDCREI